MIFVTVGMHTKGFDRLIRKIDEIAGNIDEEVVIQRGSSSFEPKNARWFDFTTAEEIKNYCREARIVVTQPAMSVLDAWEHGKPVVVVPRLKKYGEVIDDHQLDLAEELEREGKVIAVYDIDRLPEDLGKAESKPHGLTKDRRLVNALKAFIAQFEQN